MLIVLIELLALAKDWWHYAERTPLLPFTSVSAIPVAQLMVLFPLNFGLARGLALHMAAPFTS